MARRRFYLCKWPAPHHEIAYVYACSIEELRSVFANKLHTRGLQFADLIIRQFPLPPTPLVLEFKLNTPDRIDSATASNSQVYQQLQNCGLVLPLAAAGGHLSVAPAVSLSLQSGDEHDQYGAPSIAQPGWAFQTAVTRLLLPDLYDALVNLHSVEQGSGEGDELSARRRVYDEIAMFIPGPAQAVPGAAANDSDGDDDNDGDGDGGSGPGPRGRGTPGRSGPQLRVAARQTPRTPAATRGAAAPGNTRPTAPRTGPAAAPTPNTKRADLDTIQTNLDSELLASVSSSGSVPACSSAISSRANSSASKPSTAGPKVSANPAGPAHHDELAALAASAAMPLPDHSDSESGSVVLSGRSKQKTLARTKKGAASPAEASGASPASSGGMMTRSRSRDGGSGPGPSGSDVLAAGTKATSDHRRSPRLASRQTAATPAAQDSDRSEAAVSSKGEPAGATRRYSKRVPQAAREAVAAAAATIIFSSDSDDDGATVSNKGKAASRVVPSASAPEPADNAGDTLSASRGYCAQQ